jgi:myosin heavy subunit
VRNKNLMKALKMAQSDIANRTRVLASVHKIEEATAEITSQIGMIGHEFQKVGMYREAIRKQEDMILRLEGILKQMTVQTKGLRSETDKYGNEMEENERLKKNLKSYSAPDNTGETKQLRDQVRGLESEIDVLRGQLVSKAPLNAYQSERLGDIAGMQVKLHGPRRG